jgi:hypothetical protein
MPAHLPFMKFFVNDWLSDEKLSLCSLAAQGLWMRMVCFMHKNARRGYLETDGKPLSLDQLARLAGVSTELVSPLIQELLTSGVPSVTDQGVILCRRMVEKESLRLVRSEAGRKGGMAKAEREVLLKQKSAKANGKPLESNSEYFFSSEEENAHLSAPDFGLGVQGEGILPKQNGQQKGESEAWWLARVWSMHTNRKKNGCRQDIPADALPIMEVILKSGIQASTIEREILCRADDTEYLWQFKKRMLTVNGIAHEGLTKFAMKGKP